MKSVGASIVVGLTRLLSRLPLSFHYAVCRGLSWFLRNVVRYRRNVVMTNIARSFPNKKYKEIVEIEKQFYKHFGDILAEAIKISGCTSYKKLRKLDICDAVISEEFLDTYRDCSSMVVLTSHCGNWELYGGWFAYPPEGVDLGFKEDKVNVVYKELSNKLMDEVFKRNRTAPMSGTGFDGYLEHKKILRFAIEHKEDKMVYLFPTDQFPYKNAKRHEIPEFLHQKTYAMTGGAALAHKLGMSVVFLRFDSVRRGHYQMSFSTICKDASTMEPGEIMERYYSLLQEEIEAQPWNYLWSHKRWK